ncbi:MAG TPA: GNAT family N-acetyltransferase [Ilumatobacteraceae bacterium]|nr:GNAT family N-acetyltransferase [Ilumatobacteraceae bacterium]
MTTTLAFELRTAQPTDIEFEQFLYASTREDLRPLGPEVFEGLIGMQFRAQSMSIKLDHPQAERSIVLVDDSPVGRLVTDASSDHVELIDIALLPQYRNHGIGTSVLRGVFAQADRIGGAVHLHVEKQSRAVHLYERLGFAICGDLGMYFAMSRG